MLSSGNLTATNDLTLQNNQSLIVWFADGVGYNNGSNTYTLRASNFGLNLQKVSKFAAGVLGFAANSLPQVSGFDDWESFRVKDSYH